MLCDRREELTRLRVQTVNRLQRLLAELVPGQAKKDLTALQAKAILAIVRPRDMAGKTRRRIAVEELADLVAVEAKMKKSTAELKNMVKARGSRLMDLPGVGLVVAARTLADVGDIARFADRNRFASWTGTAPLDASSGEQNRHRLSRAGNRRMNHMIHIAAISQIYRQLLADAQRTALASDVELVGTGPGGHCGTTQESSAVDLPSHIDTSDQPLPGPAKPTLQPPQPVRKTSQPKTPPPVDNKGEPE
jgi:transposase